MKALLPSAPPVDGLTAGDRLLVHLRDTLRERIDTRRENLKRWRPWRELARPNQLPPTGAWFIWCLLAGRGFGKTRSGAEWVHVRGMTGDERRWMALVGKEPGNVRDQMLEGPGGLLTNTPPHERPKYEPSKRRLTWPTGAWATIYSGANPEALRGFSGDTAWVDELAAYKHPKTTWDNLMFGMREAKLADPQVCVTTTPKPIQVVRDLVEQAEREGDDGYVRITSGSSYDNRANLSKVYYDVVIAPYEGTRLGEQEIRGKLLAEVEGALWKSWQIDQLRIPPDRLSEYLIGDFLEVAIGVDPAVTSRKSSNETGITVGATGRCKCKVDQGGGVEVHGFALADLSGILTPRQWALRTRDAYQDFEADTIVGEVNNGGDLVKVNLDTVSTNLPFEDVYASRGKRTRAQPIGNLTEQGKIHHVGALPKLEDQLTTWDPHGDMDSPDRLDSYVWTFTRLMIELGGGLLWGS